MVRTDSPDTISVGKTSLVRRWFVLAASLVVLWVIGLGVLSILTANPVTLNRDQILESDDVLTAIVEDAKVGRVRIEKSWKDNVEVPTEQLTLKNLGASRVTSRERLLIPIVRSRHEWQVTPTKLPNEPPLVYPVSEESERQLRQLLKTGRLP